MGKHYLRLPSLFQSGAVFQRDIPLPVWGWSSPRHRVRCSLDDTAAITVCDCHGYFKLFLPPQKAGINKTLIVEDLSCGEKIFAKDVAIGEVYLAAGQSNMAFQLNRDSAWEQESINISDPFLRLFKVPLTKFPCPQPETYGSWQRATSESSGVFSAVGYYFGKTLRRKLDIPVGIIEASLGGMGVESFISREALLRTYLAAETSLYDLISCRENIYQDLTSDSQLPDGNAKIYTVLDQLFPDEPEKKGEKSAWHTPDFDDSAWEKFELPNNWTAAGYNHAGVFWFRKSIDIPAHWAGKNLTLNIGAADKCDETFFNGKKIGATGHFRRFENWNTPRSYSIPGKLVHSGCNNIAVRVASAASICFDGGLTGPAEAMFLECDGEKIPLAGMWKMKMEHFFGTCGMEFMRLLGPGAAASLHMLFDNIINPLIPFAMRGVLWYQGEANAICMAEHYQELLSTMISDWRQRWGQKNFDFIIIQLPEIQPGRPYDHYSQWAKLRDAQRKIALTTADCQLIVTLGYGDPNDLHPRNKFTVGMAAGNAAAGKITGQNISKVPSIQKCTTDGNKFIVTFDTPLQTAQNEKPEMLMLAGKDGIFYPACGTISGTELTVTSPRVSEPVKIRYAWSNNPAKANIYGENGLMISPFEAE